MVETDRRKFWGGKTRTAIVHRFNPGSLTSFCGRRFTSLDMRFYDGEYFPEGVKVCPRCDRVYQFEKLQALAEDAR